MHLVAALQYHEPGEETVEVQLSHARFTPWFIRRSRHGFEHLRAAVELSAGKPRMALSVKDWKAVTAEAVVAAAEYAEHFGQPDAVSASFSHLLHRADGDELAKLSPEGLRALIALSEAHGRGGDLVRRLVEEEASELGGRRLRRLPLDAVLDLIRLAPTPPDAALLEPLLALAARQSRLLRGEPLARYALAVLRLSDAGSADKPLTRPWLLMAPPREESILELLALTPRRLASMPEAARKDVEALIEKASLKASASP
jgi:hypothetical protein